MVIKTLCTLLQTLENTVATSNEGKLEVIHTGKDDREIRMGEGSDEHIGNKRKLKVIHEVEAEKKVANVWIDAEKEVKVNVKFN